MIVRTYQNDNLDAVIYRYFGTSYGLLEPTLGLNPHLADIPILPIGTLVELPDVTASPSVKSDSIQLWD